MLVDLTRPMTEAMPVYPGDPLFQSVPTADHATDGFRLSKLSFGSHTGTHLDAPFHYFEDGETLDRLPLETFFLTALVINLTPWCVGTNGRPAMIRPETLEPFAPALERFEAILLKTGWEHRWGKSDFYDAFPSVLPETAEWLADYPIRLLGLETPSLASIGNALFADEGKGGAIEDWGTGEGADELTLHADAESHRILLGRTPPILLLEGLAHLDALPCVSADDCQNHFDTLFGRSFRLICFPLPVDRSDGSPVRAVALIE